MNEVFRFTTVSTGFYWFIKRLDLCGSIWGLTNSCGTGFLSDCQWNWFPIFVLVLFSRGLYVEWCGETVVIVRLPADFPSFSYFFGIVGWFRRRRKVTRCGRATSTPSSSSAGSGRADETIKQNLKKKKAFGNSVKRTKKETQ